MKKTTLITGAGRGIGLEIAKIFASKNENLILIIRKSNQKRIIEKLMKNYNSQVKIFVGDLNNLNFIKKIGETVKYVTTIITVGNPYSNIISVLYLDLEVFFVNNNEVASSPYTAFMYTINSLQRR